MRVECIHNRNQILSRHVGFRFIRQVLQGLGKQLDLLEHHLHGQSILASEWQQLKILKCAFFALQDLTQELTCADSLGRQIQLDYIK